jgi:hypothetical protein
MTGLGDLRDQRVVNMRIGHDHTPPPVAEPDSDRRRCAAAAAATCSSETAGITVLRRSARPGAPQNSYRYHRRNDCGGLVPKRGIGHRADSEHGSQNQETLR